MNTGLESQVNIFRSKNDRELLLLEASNDIEFERQLSDVLTLPDGEERVVTSAHKAVLNELDPSLYPELAGAWPVLRSVIRKVMDRVGSSTVSKISTINPPAKGLGDLGQFEVLGPLISSIAGAGASIYSSEVQASAQKQIASQQLQANMQEIQAQEAMAAAQKAMANAQTTQAVQKVLPTPLAVPVAGAINALTAEVVSGSGIQIWEILLVGYFVFKELR